MSLIDLYINDGGNIRRIGDDPHDMLMIWKGKLWYHNLQNGDGCRLGEESEWYSFVENADEYGYNCDPRKTENSSENPNNCEDEPTHNQHVQHIGSVETMSCQECKRWIYDDRWGWFCPLKGQDECKYEPKDEPQTDDAYFLELMGAVERGEISDAGANQAWYEYINHKDEQTERSE